MLSNNGLMNEKNKFFSFINKGIMILVETLLLAILFPCFYVIFLYWSEMSILVKMFCPILFMTAFIGIIISPFNGMMITKNGNILFFPDFRLKKLNIKDLKCCCMYDRKWLLYPTTPDAEHVSYTSVP